MRAPDAIFLLRALLATIPAACREITPDVAAASPEPIPVARVDAAQPRAPRFELPADWDRISDAAFERQLDAGLPLGEERSLSAGDRATLARAITVRDATALRAAVILARTREPEAGEALLAQLEDRGAPVRDTSDASLVVAAAAFTQGSTATDAARRLIALAVGRAPHPEPCVRVECARSALVLGRDEAIPYLLGLLRIGTNAPGAPLEVWEEADLALAQLRAADALAERAGTTSRFRPEASVREREDEAQRLEGLLPRPPKRR